MGKHKTMAKKLLFFSLLIFSLPVQADLFSDHVVPSVKDGFDRKGLWIAVGGLAAVSIAQTQDYKMREDFSRNNRMSSSASKIGDFLGTGIPGSAIALTQLFVDPEMGGAHAEALIDTMIMTSALKYANSRGRPNSDNHHSMPSGHTSTTFATSTSLAYAYGWKAAVPAYSLAVFTAVSRWSDDAHWFSDTVGGAFIGYFWGRATYFHHALSEGASKNEKAEPVSAFLPVFSSQHVGFLWNAEF